jgi:hypothetical protein
MGSILAELVAIVENRLSREEFACLTSGEQESKKAQ